MTSTSIYALGSNGSGQLGLGHQNDVSMPTLLSVPEELAHHKIVDVAAGGNHTLILTETGNVYASGTNADGRCGFGAGVDSVSQFSRVRLSCGSHQDLNVELCAATWDASIFATNHGVVVCGAGAKGELGLGGGRTSAPTPELINDFPPESTEVVQLTACMGHVVAVLSNGDAYGWGVGTHGQLGEPREDVWIPRKVRDVPFKVGGAVCGKDFTCLFSSSEEGHFLLLGPSKRDRYGIRASVPTVLRGWRQVAASWGSLYVLMPSGQLLAWGRNDHGQLPPAGLPSLDTICAGSEHMLAVDVNGQVLAWGWGEHGNCGTPVDERCDVNGRYNVLEVPKGKITVGAGCATSFVAISGG